MIKFIIIGIIVVLVVLIISLGYVKAPPDQAFIISGLRRKVVIGKAAIKVPFLERKDFVNLKLIPIDVKTSNAVPTRDYININIDAAVNIKVSSEKDKLELAAQNFLNMSTTQIAEIAREVLEGNMREIVGKMGLEEMVGDRQKFAELVKENAEPDLAGMGLDIVSFNVQNFFDNNNVIENLGIDNIVRIKKGAAIAKAQSEKDIAQAEAEAKKDTVIAQAEAEKTSKEIQIRTATEIAQKENELSIRRSELKQEADTKKAVADAAYEIQKQEQRKTIEIATANATLAAQEKEISLQEQKAAIAEKLLDAQVKKQAEADKFAKQQQADARLYERQRQAEAEAFEKIKQAEAQKVFAEADKYAKEQEAEAVKYKALAEAEAIRAKGDAEAEAIRAKGIAEAQGIEKKAEAMAKMEKAAVMEMYFKALPDVVRAASAPLANVDKITMYGDGNNTKLVKDIMATVTQVTDGLKESTGIDLNDVLASFTGTKIAMNSLNNREANVDNNIIEPVAEDNNDEATTEASDL